MIASLEIAFEQAHTERAFDETLDGPPQRARAEQRIVALLGQPDFDRVAQGNVQAVEDKPLLHFLDLQIHNTHHILQRQRPKNDDFIYPVEKFRAEGLSERRECAPAVLLIVIVAPPREAQRPTPLQVLGAHVGGHNHNRVAEIHQMPLAVGQPPLVEDLQKRVPHILMGLFNLVEEDYLIGPAAHSLGELPPLIIAHIARRRAE